MQVADSQEMRTRGDNFPGFIDEASGASETVMGRRSGWGAKLGAAGKSKGAMELMECWLVEG